MLEWVASFGRGSQIVVVFESKYNCNVRKKTHPKVRHFKSSASCWIKVSEANSFTYLSLFHRCSLETGGDSPGICRVSPGRRPSSGCQTMPLLPPRRSPLMPRWVSRLCCWAWFHRGDGAADCCWWRGTLAEAVRAVNTAAADDWEDEDGLRAAGCPPLWVCHISPCPPRVCSGRSWGSCTDSAVAAACRFWAQRDLRLPVASPPPSPSHLSVVLSRSG